MNDASLCASHLSTMYKDGSSLLRELCISNEAEHSMGPALPRYVAQRVNEVALEFARAHNFDVTVEGVYPVHARAIWPDLDYFPIPQQGRGKWGNSVRSTYAVDLNGDVGRVRVFCPPGRDYNLHHGELIQSALGPNHRVREVIHFPSVDSSVLKWTGLERGRFDTAVVVGYAEQLATILTTFPDVSNLGTTGNSYYMATRLRFRSGRSVTFLAFRFSFWGSMARRLAAGLASNGLTELYYCGKLGTMGNDAPYQRLYTPSAYYSLYGGVMTETRTPKNPLLSWRSGLDSGGHLSVPTMMRETRTLIDRACSNEIQTIDNEITEFAAGLSEAETDCGFSALHFATDRPHGRSDLSTERHDLTSARLPGERRARESSLNSVAITLHDFFTNGTRGGWK